MRTFPQVTLRFWVLMNDALNDKDEEKSPIRYQMTFGIWKSKTDTEDKPKQPVQPLSIYHQMLDIA